MAPRHAGLRRQAHHPFVITRLSRAMRSLKHLLALADELRERGVIASIFVPLPESRIIDRAPVALQEFFRYGPRPSSQNLHDAVCFAVQTQGNRLPVIPAIASAHGLGATGPPTWMDAVRQSGRRPCVLLAAAELDDQPDYLSSDPEGQLHASFHVVPARTSAAFACHIRAFLPVRPAIVPPG